MAIGACTGGANLKSYTRHMMHMIYGAPWLKRIDRLSNSSELLSRVTPQQRALLGEFDTSVGPFHSSSKVAAQENLSSGASATFTYHPPSQVCSHVLSLARLNRLCGIDIDVCTC